MGNRECFGTQQYALVSTPLKVTFSTAPTPPSGGCRVAQQTGPPPRLPLAEPSEQLEAASDLVDCIFFTNHSQHSAGARLHLQATLITKSVGDVYGTGVCPSFRPHLGHTCILD